MPIICIGPVCIPIAALIPMLLFIFRPIYNRLPKTYQQKIDGYIKMSQLALNAFFRKIGWGNSDTTSVVDTNADTEISNAATPTKTTNVVESGQQTNDNANDNDNERSSSSSAVPVRALKDEQEWEHLLLRSKTSDFEFVAYFTSKWCKPCKKIYPVFEELAKHAHAISTTTSTMPKKKQNVIEFVKVDVDEFDDLMVMSSVNKLPTFLLFRDGKECLSVSGSSEDTLRQFFIKIAKQQYSI